MPSTYPVQSLGPSPIVLIASVLALCGISAGCGQTPAQPTPPRQVETTLAGSVIDSLGQPLGDARVEIVDGRQAGRSTTTDATGSFTLVGTFNDATQVRATKDGYLERATAVSGWWSSGSASRSVTFALSPVGTGAVLTPLFVAGDAFTLTLAADNACTAIPAEFRTRTYEMTVAGPSPTHAEWFSVIAHGKEFLEGHDYFPIRVTGNAVQFQLHEDGFPYMAERVAPNAYLAFSGEVVVSGATRGSVIAGSSRGAVSYCEVASPGGDYYLSFSRECPSSPLVLGQCEFFQLILAPR